MYTGPGTLATGFPIHLQAFWTVAHIGYRHNIYFSSTNPLRTRLHLRDAGPEEGVVLCIYYGQPNRVEVFLKGRRVQPVAEPTWDNQALPILDASMPNGMHVYDRIGVGPTRRPGYLHVVVKGPDPIELRVTKKIKLTKKLERGEKEFVYQKGPQGLVRNIALLLNIPEHQIKIVGLGAMKKGEIWNNRTSGGYRPKLLQLAEEGGAMGFETEEEDDVDVVIDPPDADNEDEIELKEEELVEVYGDAVEQCDKKTINCKGKPEIDVPPKAGWTCAPEKYGKGDGCDCDCGIWDPDCEAGSDYGYTISTGESVKALDKILMEQMLKKYDNKPYDHKLGSNELAIISLNNAANSPIALLAKEVADAGKDYTPLVKVALQSTCPTNKVCLRRQNKVDPLSNEPLGVCLLPETKPKGSACDSDPCGTCSDVKCMPSNANSWDYTCVPAFLNKPYMIMNYNTPYTFLTSSPYKSSRIKEKFLRRYPIDVRNAPESRRRNSRRRGWIYKKLWRLEGHKKFDESKHLKDKQLWRFKKNSGDKVDTFGIWHDAHQSKLVSMGNEHKVVVTSAPNFLADELNDWELQKTCGNPMTIKSRKWEKCLFSKLDAKTKKPKLGLWHCNSAYIDQHWDAIPMQP